ncbi:unnamed protein product [Prorocentrum cordatum]|uniref:Uncharacterized protein n=1 Tax=Prorocentrum cordatum TaxID=2364126 RepID=A0ABN9RHV8_9DINO|nr:unnamed protein product [Polarella glacialis]
MPDLMSPPSAHHGAGGCAGSGAAARRGVSARRASPGPPRERGRGSEAAAAEAEAGARRRLAEPSVGHVVWDSRLQPWKVAWADWRERERVGGVYGAGPGWYIE